MGSKDIKIMIIEDNKSFLETIQDILENKGFEVATACDGKDVIRKVEGENPDLILLDINLPDIDGFTICRELKANKATSIIPIILMTGDETVDIDKGFSLGADDCVFKPFDIDLVSERIKKLARRKYRILVVEDDRKICAIVSSLLLEQHYNPKTIFEGSKIFEEIKNFRPDLILLDIFLQVPPDGLELCRKIKKNPETAMLPVVMLTSNDDVASVEKCFSSGADDYVFKPFKVQDLLLRIKKYTEFSKDKQ